MSASKVYFYSIYERVWHWFQALAMTVLIISGFEISYVSFFSVTGFESAVTIHNMVGLLLTINAFLALFYNVAGGLIKRYVPGIDDFLFLGFKHARYYMYGIFRGEAHPFEKTPGKRLLPLQKISYFMILNVLLPLMTITGLFKMSAYYDPSIVEIAGGLSVLGPLHRFGAWLFLAFVILHMYMTTTGHTPLSSLMAMITGYETVENKEETVHE